MSLSSEKIGHIVTVSVAGRINSANATQVESDLLDCLDGDVRYCVLDLSAVDYISSVGLRIVLMLAKRLKQHQGRLVLCGLQPQIHEVFEISGFLSFLELRETRSDALNTLNN